MPQTDAEACQLLHSHLGPSKLPKMQIRDGTAPLTNGPIQCRLCPDLAFPGSVSEAGHPEIARLSLIQDSLQWLWNGIAVGGVLPLGK